MIARVWRVDQVDCDFTIGSIEGVPVLKLHAAGYVTSTGWRRPELAPWIYIQPPTDGFLSLDFLAEGPDPQDIVTYPILPIEVSQLFPIPGWVVGARVHASQNIVETRFRDAGDERGNGGVKPTGEGLPLPWPFPWYTPRSTEIR